MILLGLLKLLMWLLWLLILLEWLLKKLWLLLLLLWLIPASLIVLKSSLIALRGLLITLMRSLESDHSLGLPDLVLLGTGLESLEVVGAHLGLGGLEAEEEVMR